jgi:uncharacterized protein YjbI with pentapeptide repeats
MMEQVAELNIEELKKSSNKKFQNMDFSKLKLPYADFRLASLINCKFVDTDLKFANFQGANCFGCDFTGANLYRANMGSCCLENAIFKPRDCYGITITLNCETYAGMEVDDTWLKVWWFIPAVMRIPEPARDKLIQFLGSKTYLKYKQVFDRRIL